jgi:hypothetical protein
MAYPDYGQLLVCPKCGNIGAIYVLKVAGLKIVIKQKCPKHGGRSVVFPFMQKDYLIPHVRDAVFRCFKCGQPAPVGLTKIEGPWTLIKCNCPTHGTKLPFQKIWSSMYIEIAGQLPIGQDFQQPQVQQPEKVQLEQTEFVQHKFEQPQSNSENGKKFCPNCGSLLMGTEKFCGICGEEIS